MAGYRDPLADAMVIRTKANIAASERLSPAPSTVEPGDIGYQGECCVCGTKSPPIKNELPFRDKRWWAENDGILCPEHAVMFNFTYLPAWTRLDFAHANMGDAAERLRAMRQQIGVTDA